eukprot:18744-Eustigmatos_ZCMA.PRE.1
MRKTASWRSAKRKLTLARVRPDVCREPHYGQDRDSHRHYTHKQHSLVRLIEILDDPAQRDEVDTKEDCHELSAR